MFFLRFHEAMKHLVLASPLRGLSTAHTPSFLSSSLPSPPHSLLDYPPLAVLTNTLIQAFNDLRQCAPLAGGPEISQELGRLLESTVHDVGEYYRYVEMVQYSFVQPLEIGVLLWKLEIGVVLQCTVFSGTVVFKEFS